MDEVYSKTRKSRAQTMEEETAYLLRSPKNARRLLESIAELESGRGAEHKLSE